MDRILRRGSYGPDVEAWQNFLLGEGLYNYRVDSDFGRRTEAATKKFQSSEGESLESDFREVVSDLDRAARKGVIPKKRADRHKSRLAKQLARKKTKG